MRKFLFGILTLIMIICSFDLVACFKEPEHKHDYTILKSNETVHWYECECGEKSAEEEHKDGQATLTEKAKCSVCNTEYGDYEREQTEGLLFSLINNGTEYEVCGYIGGSTEVIIPDTYNGKPVTNIGGGAFVDCRSLTSIVVPNSVEAIAYGAFLYCNSLQYNIEGNLKYLGNSENPYLYLAGTTSDDIPSATINANCKIIGYDAFYRCESLTSIVIPNSVQAIGNSTFSNCESLTSIVIPNSVQAIGYGAFSGCDSLQYNIEGNLKYLYSSSIRRGLS